MSLGANPHKDIIMELVPKLWLQYVEAERRSAYPTVLVDAQPDTAQDTTNKACRKFCL